MQDGVIALGTPEANELGFTADKFDADSYLYKDGDSIYISLIKSIEERKGYLKSLVDAIRNKGFRVKIPTPLGRMVAIVEKNGYVLTMEPFEDYRAQVWVLG